jgi:GMP synthase (glutamine-hydrolysing)
MGVKEITLEALDPQAFIDTQVKAIKEAVGGDVAINALSGGVDSSVVTMLGHKALGEKLKTYFVENGLMREGEPEKVVGIFKNLGVPVEIVDEKDKFFAALKGVTDPEEKREKGITQVFYKDIFARLVKESGAKILLQGTIYTDIEETAAGIKRQHNVFEQIGIDPEEAFGYKVVEPLIELRKPAVREVARAVGLPKEISDRPPFPGPALCARVINEVTPERIAIVRKATVIVEEELADSGAFQCMAILHDDMVTGLRDGKRDFGRQIEVRCWESTDAVTGTPTELPFASFPSPS